MDDPRHSLTAPKSLSQLLGGLPDSGGGLGALQRAWVRVVGPEMAAACMPVALRDGELRVRCATAAWASELLALAGQILPRLAPEVDTADAPVRIKPYTGRVEAAPSNDGTEASLPPPPLTPPSPADLGSTEAQLVGIADPALRASLAKAIVASRARSNHPQ